METMQQMVLLGIGRKSMRVGFGFHFGCKDRGICTKYQVQSTKNDIRVIGCFCLLRSTLDIRHSKFSIPYLVSRTSYFVLFTLYLVSGTLYNSVFPTLYFVLGTLYYFSPNSILTELMQ